MIDIGCYIEAAIEWLTEEGAVFFDALNVGVESFIDSFQLALYAIPFYVFIPLTVLLAWWKVGKGMGAFTLLGLLLIWGMGFWEETMQTLALVLSSTCMALLIGIPLGIWAGKSERCNRMLRPVLDCMQTMPAFVYLIPAVLFFGLGTVPGAFATIIFAMPPVVRLTGLGIRQVPENVIEAARSFGATPRQLLFKVQLPLALPTILTGINQTIMMALSMVVVSAMISAGGLGEVVLKGITQMKIGLGFEGGIAEVRNFIKDLSVDRGKTILISSHILSEIALLANDIGIIDHGVLLEESSMEDLEKKNRKYIQLQVSDVPKASLILERQFHVTDYAVQDEHNLRLYDTALDMAAINKALVVQDVAVISSQICNNTLEDHFKQITGGEGIA